MQADRQAPHWPKIFEEGQAVQTFCEVKITHLEITKKYKTF
jgi:hypothetical protein